MTEDTNKSQRDSADGIHFTLAAVTKFKENVISQKDYIEKMDTRLKSKGLLKKWYVYDYKLINGKKAAWKLSYKIIFKQP